MIDAHKKGIWPDINFSPPYKSFDLIFAEEGKDDEDGYIPGSEFDSNTPLYDPNNEGDGERPGAV